MALPPQFQKNAKAKKKGPPMAGKKGVNPFAKKTAGPPGAPSAKGAPIDPATLGSMTNSLKGVGK